MPSARKRAATVDLPMPMEPVRPTTQHQRALDVGDQQGAQLVGDLRAHAEPFLEARHRLVQQHAEAVDGGEARARARPRAAA